MNKCGYCQKETKNPKYCDRKCASAVNSKTVAKARWKGCCKDCGKRCINRWSRCEDCRDIYHNISRSPNCLICGVVKTEENTAKRTHKKGLNAYCYSCSYQLVVISKRNFKIMCLTYKGGECERCGYNECPAALQFHHLDPSQKEFTISSYKKRTNLDDEIKAELDKCAVLCSNCHFKEHFDETIISSEVINFCNSHKGILDLENKE